MNVVMDGQVVTQMYGDVLLVRLTDRASGNERTAEIFMARFPESDRANCVPGAMFTVNDSPVTPQCHLVTAQNVPAIKEHLEQMHPEVEV